MRVSLRTTLLASLGSMAVMLNACGSDRTDSKTEGGAPSAIASGMPSPSPSTSAPVSAPKVLAPELGEKRKLSQVAPTQEKVAEYRRGVEAAMDRIPEDLREDFQKAFACQAAKNAKLDPRDQIEMDGSWILRKTEQLRTSRELGLAC